MELYSLPDEFEGPTWKLSSMQSVDNTDLETIPLVELIMKRKKISFA
jgi:hypothetical protein